MIEQKVEEDFTEKEYEIMLSPLFQFSLLFGDLGKDDYTRENRERLATCVADFEKRFPQLKDTPMALFYKGFALGVMRTNDLWGKLMGLDDEDEESSDATAATETAK